MVIDIILNILNLLRAWFNATLNLTVLESKDNDDNDSIVSFNTACEEIVAPDNRESVPAHTAQNTCPSRRTPKVVSPNRWYEPDKYYDENPGAKVDPAVIEDHDILLPFSSVFLYKWRHHVEALSGATISIFPNDSSAPHVFRLRLTGTHLNAIYAFQAYNTIFDTSRNLTGTVWVILQLNGPWMADGVQELKRRSPRFLSNDGFIAPADLHVSVGLFNTSPYRTLEDLCHIVDTLVNDPNSSVYCSLRRTFELKLDKCTCSIIRMAPTNWHNPIAIITDVFRNTLVDHHFIVERYSMAHMTVFKGPCVRGMPESPLDLGFVPDFGPLRISSVVISDYALTLTGPRYVNLAEFAVDQ